MEQFKGNLDCIITVGSSYGVDPCSLFANMQSIQKSENIGNNMQMNAGFFEL
jgi:hypothetical protein